MIHTEFHSVSLDHFFVLASFKFLSYSPKFFHPFSLCHVQTKYTFSELSSLMKIFNSFMFMTQPHKAALDTAFLSGISLIPVLQV